NFVLCGTLNFRFEMNTCGPICSELREAFSGFFDLGKRPVPCGTRHCRRPPILTMANFVYLSTVNDLSKYRYRLCGASAKRTTQRHGGAGGSRRGVGESVGLVIWASCTLGR